VLLWSLGCARCASVEPPRPTPPVAAASTSTAPTTGRFALGINEAVSIPMKVRGAGPPDEGARAALRRDAAATVALGAQLVRGHSGNYPRSSWHSWTHSPEIAQGETDAWVSTVTAAGLTPVLMLSPWPGNQTGNYTTTYVPDLPSYQAWVTKVVERYDGDGVDDMPGLPAPVRHFEVDNEPDLKNTNVPRGGDPSFDPSRFCLPEEYGRVVLATSAGIRAASPEATILAGGFYRPHARGTHVYMDALFTPEVRAAFDVLSVHTYADDDGTRLAEGIRAVRARVSDKPVWVTETSASSEALGPEGHAAALVAFVAQSAIAGAERLFWHTLADPPQRSKGPGGFKTNSLLQQGPGGALEDKPAAAAFRALAKVLAAHDLVGATLEAPGLARLTDGSHLLFAGTRTTEKGGVDLRTGATISPGSVATAPAWMQD
jgi:Glycosyl hydrolase catalytic core